MPNSEFVCIGDYICLYCDATQGYVTSWQTSEAFSQVFVYTDQSRENPSGITNPQVLVFQIVLQNRYKLNKKYKKIIDLNTKDPENQELKAALAEAKASADTETEDNEDEQLRLHGKSVCYGDIIQLKHMLTGKFIRISTTETSLRDKYNLTVFLDHRNGKQAQFRLLPRYKVKGEREGVHFLDQVVFESVKCPGQYFHASSSYNIDINNYGSELNLGVDFTGITLMKYYRSAKKSKIDNCIRGGSVLRIVHNDLEANLVAAGLTGQTLIEDVHLKVREKDVDRPSTLEPTTAGVSFWQIVHENSLIQGDAVRWGQHIRLHHMTTGQYLVIDDYHEVCLDSDHKDPNTVFRLHPVGKLENDEIKLDSYVRIEHILTGRWLHADRNNLYGRKHYELSDIEDLHSSNKLLIKISSSSEQLFSDAYTLQRVEDKLVQEFNYVAGSVHFLQNILLDIKETEFIDDRRTADVCSALAEMKKFMLLMGEPEKTRQKFLRNLRVVDLLVELLMVQLGDREENIVKIFGHAFDVLHTYLMGPSRRNKIYFLKYLDFFQNQFTAREHLQLKVAQLLVELIRDCRPILNKIDSDQVKRFVELQKVTKRSCYLELLSVLCVCNGVAIPDNQCLIVDFLLRQHPNGLFLTKFGTELGFNNDDIYVSPNYGDEWKELSTLLEEDNQAVISRSMYFFLRQLDLYLALCYGRNEYSIEVITKEMKYLTWREAYLAVSNDHLPATVRAKYCELLIVLFMNTSTDQSRIEITNSCFICTPFQLRKYKPESRVTIPLNERAETSQPLQNLQLLRVWIRYFLSNCKTFVASEIGRNMLIEQVLRLLQYLIKHGHYADTDDLEDLNQTVFNLLYGRGDQPFPSEFVAGENLPVKRALEITNLPLITDVINSTRERKVAIQLFQRKLRFEKSIENSAIVNAKFWALEILELILTTDFNRKLKTLFELFKYTAYEYSPSKTRLPGLTENLLQSLRAFLTDEFNSHIYSKNETKEHKRLKIVLHNLLNQPTQLSTGSLVASLMDLNKYKYDKLVSKSLQILNKYFSMGMDVYTVASSVQVLIAPKSIVVHDEVEKIVNFLRNLGKSRLSESQIQEAIAGLDILIRLCVVDGEPTVPHRINQDIILNFDTFALLLNQISSELEGRTSYLQDNVIKMRIRCVHLLKALANGNNVVQTKIYDRMDFLLKLTGIESEIALLLKEAFKGNPGICFQVQDRQMERLVHLIGEYKETVPEFLELIISIVKVGDTPLKGKQAHVMKHFMRLFGKIGDIFEQSKEFRVSVLLEERGSRPRTYILALVMLLGICAEGENRLIDSLCKTILPVDEILDILCNDRIDFNAKKPFVVYLHNVYLAEGVEIGYANITHNRKLWNYMKKLRLQVIWLYRYLSKRIFLLDAMLKISPPIGENADLRDVSGRAHAAVHYMFDSVLPFLMTFVSRYYDADADLFPEEITIVDQLNVVLLHYCQAIKQHLSSPAHSKVILTTMAILLSTSSVPQKTSQAFLSEMAGCLTIARESESITNYKRMYAEETKINEQFGNFVKNCSAIEAGQNTLGEQINYFGKKANKEYTHVSGDECLPLGADFQQLVRCFIQPQKRLISGQYKRVITLIYQLGLSAKQRSTKDVEANVRYDKLDIRCLQILRALLHNEIVKLGTNWWPASSRATRSTVKRIEAIQGFMVDHDVFAKTMPLMNSKSDDVVREMLSFMAALLFNANTKVQDSLLIYCESTKSEALFLTICDKIQLSISAVKERRALLNLHMNKLDEFELLARRKRFQSNLLVVRSALQNLEVLGPQPEFSAYAVSAAAKYCHLDRTSDTYAQKRDTQKKQFQIKDKGHIELVLKVLSLMCDGQHSRLQEYIRDQPDNMKSVKTVQEVITFLHAVYASIDATNVDLIIHIFQSLYKFTLGNQPTRADAVSIKIIDIINVILREEHFDCSLHKILELKQAIGYLILSFIEENGSQELETAMDVKDTLDHDAVFKLIKDCYVCEKSSKNKSIKQVIRTLGYTFSLIMKRFYDVDETLQKKHFNEEMGLTADQRRAFLSFNKGIYAVEIIKDETIQKVNFRVYSKSLLKEEVREKLKWNVDRSSQVEKIRHFIYWYRDLKSDLKYQQRVQSNIFTACIARYWSAWNTVCFILSLMINVYMIVTWKAKVSLEDLTNLAPGEELPAELFDPHARIANEDTYDRFVYASGIIHNFFSLLVVSGYLLSNHPKLPSLKSSLRRLRNIVWSDDQPLLTSTGELGPQDANSNSNCAVHILSFKTFYYAIFMMFSVLGTCFRGYFFAFHLLNIITSNQLLGGVIQSVTKNGKSLIWVAVLGLVIFYLYALVAFAFFRHVFDPTAYPRPAFCNSLLQCSISVLRYGLIGDYDEALVLDTRSVSFRLWGYLVIFKLSFFVIITTIGLNIIFGIIVDTFSELRNRKWRSESDMKDRCFICGISAYEFDSRSKGFKHHVLNEHNMWAYMYYLIHLNDIGASNYTALDMYVNKKILKQEYDFFPINRALCLSSSDTDSTKSKIDELLIAVKAIAEKQLKEELEKKRKEDHKKQLHWEEAHKSFMRKPGSSDGLYTPVYISPEDRRRSISCPGPPPAISTLYR